MKEREKLFDGVVIPFSPEVAAALGINEAIFLAQLHYWLQHSKNERDGFKWCYKTYEEWHEEIKYLSIITLKRLVPKLEKKKIVVSTDKYNKFRADRTKWYRIDYEVFDRIMVEYALEQNQDDTSDSIEMIQGEYQIDTPNGIEEIHSEYQSDKETKYQNASSNNHNITHSTTQDNNVQNSTVNKSSSSSFEEPSVFITPNGPEKPKVDDVDDDESISINHNKISIQDVYNAAQLIFDVNDNIKCQLSIAIRICGLEAINAAIQQLAQQDYDNDLKVDDVLALAQQIKAAS